MLLTRRNKKKTLSKSRKSETTRMVVHTTRHVSRTTFWFVDTHTRIHTHTHTHTHMQTDTQKTIPAFTIATGKNKCIGDNTKAAARRSPNCIKKTKKNIIRRNTVFNMADGILSPCNAARGSGIITLNSLGASTLQGGTWLLDDTTLNLQGDSTLKCGT